MSRWRRTRRCRSPWLAALVRPTYPVRRTPQYRFMAWRIFLLALWAFPCAWIEDDIRRARVFILITTSDDRTTVRIPYTKISGLCKGNNAMDPAYTYIPLTLMFDYQCLTFWSIFTGTFIGWRNMELTVYFYSASLVSVMLRLGVRGSDVSGTKSEIAFGRQRRRREECLLSCRFMLFIRACILMSILSAL